MLRLLLAAAVPLQGLLDKPSPTHGFINRQAMKILAADGMTRETVWLGQFLDDFNSGCDWADTGWKNVGHMYDPETGVGFGGWPNALQTMREHWNRARHSFYAQDFRNSFFYLGAAAHVVQDLCVPHHAAARLFAGHQQFEAYAQRYRHRFAVHEGGLYDLARTPEGWVLKNASYTRTHYTKYLGGDLSRARLDRAIGDLLPRAQRATAGFIRYALKKIGVSQ